MGWTFTRKEKGETVKSFFEKEFTQDGKTGVLDCAVVNRRTAYIAYKSARDGHVFAIVCLLDYRPHDYNYNFGYKDMDESTGPFEYDCPERILNLLSPPSPGYAKEWREKCIANLEKRRNQPKVEAGDQIKFATPITFRNGLKLDTFTVLKPNSSVFIGAWGSRYRIPNWKRNEFTIVKRSA